MTADASPSGGGAPAGGAPAGEPAGAEAAELEALTFEQLVEELEQVTRAMSSGDIGIEAVADLYDRAGRLHAAATERLERVRQRIEALDGSPPGAPA